jgi:NAD(P)H-flavin reductase
MNPMVPQPWIVTRLRRENQDTITIELQPVDAAGDYSFAAGQFNMLYVFGVGEVPLSMSGGSTRAGRLAHTVRAVGAVSRAIGRLKRGAMVGVRGPFGSHWPVAEASGGDVLLMAGGIGIAPLRPALQHLLDNRQAYKRIAVLYGARAPENLLYLKELEKWRSHDLQVAITVDSASTGWRGHVGTVTTLLPRVAFVADYTTAMICGPEIMMRFGVRELQKCGVVNQKIFLSMERNMKCAVGFCGHCQFGPTFICKDGPVFSYDRIKHWFEVREI